MTDARLDDALGQLFSFSLAKRVAGGRSFSMHPLVHTWARERLDRKHQATIAGEAVRLLGAKLASFGRDYLTRADFERNVVSHVGACVENATSLGAVRHLKFRWTGLPYLPSWVTNAVNYGILQIFRYPDHAFVRLLDEIAQTCDNYHLQCAKDLRRATLEWSINILGPYDFWTLRRMTSISNSLGRDGLGDAMAFILEALERHETIQGITHQSTIRNIGIRSDVDLTLGKFGQAVGAFQRFLYGKKIHGPNHKYTLKTVSELGWENVKQGKVVEGEELLRRALVGLESVTGPDHPCDADLLGILAGLADTTFRQKFFEETENFCRRLLQCREKLRGPYHSDTLEALSNLVSVNYEQGKFEEAEGLLRRLLESREKLLGPDNSDTLAALQSVG